MNWLNTFRTMASSQRWVVVLLSISRIANGPTYANIFSQNLESALFAAACQEAFWVSFLRQHGDLSRHQTSSRQNRVYNQITMVSGASEHSGSDFRWDKATPEERRAYKAEIARREREAHIRALVDEAPPLSAEQSARLMLLLSPGRFAQPKPHERQKG